MAVVVSSTAQQPLDKSQHDFENILSTHNPTNLDTIEIICEFQEQLRRRLDIIGTKNQNRILLWKVLNDGTKKYLWGAAMNVANDLGIPRSDVANWLKKHLDEVALEGDLLAHQELISLLSEFGSKAEGDHIMKLADSLPNSQKTQAALMRKTAGKIISRFEPYPWPDTNGPSTHGKSQSSVIRRNTAGSVTPIISAYTSTTVLPAKPDTISPKWILWFVFVLACVFCMIWLFRHQFK